jgi:hypothetical protein
MSDIFCKDWPWQIREITPCKYLVRFPPDKRVANLKSLPSFNLRKEGVQVGVMEWVGDLDHFSELKEVWISLEEIPPKWCDYKVFAQMASGFGLLRDVDWSSLFKSFYQLVRMKVACRNPKKIPLERLFELDRRLYLISIHVEGFEQEDVVRAEMDDDDGLDDFGNDVQHDGGEDDTTDHHSMETGGSLSSKKLVSDQGRQFDQRGSRIVLSTNQAIMVDQVEDTLTTDGLMSEQGGKADQSGSKSGASLNVRLEQSKGAESIDKLRLDQGAP